MEPEGVSKYSNVFPTPEVITIPNSRPLSLFYETLKDSTCLILTIISDFPVTAIWGV